MSTEPDQSAHLIVVPGLGSVTSRPDTAQIYVGVTVQKPTAKDARAAGAAGIATVLEAVRGLGIAETDLRTSTLTVNAIYDRDGKPSGNQFRTSLRVTIRDLGKVPQVVDAAMAAGATNIGQISFSVDKPDVLEAQARELAMADARSRAEQLARLAGLSIRGVARIEEIDSVVGPALRARAATMGGGVSTPVEEGETVISIGLVVSFLVG